MGDGCVHATSACDYRHLKKMRLAATIYVADVNEENVGNILNEYTQEYPHKIVNCCYSGRRSIGRRMTLLFHFRNRMAITSCYETGPIQQPKMLNAR